MLDRVGEFCTLLLTDSNNEKGQSGWSSPKNMTEWSSYLAFDVVSSLAYGKSFGMLVKPDLRYVRQAVERFAKGQQLAGQSPELFATQPDKWYNLRKFLIPGYLEYRHDFESLGRARAKERVEAPPYKHPGQRKDIMDFVIGAKDPETGEPFTMREVMAESNLMIGAGALSPHSS